MLETTIFLVMFIVLYVLTAVMMLLYPRLSRKTVSFGISIPASAWSSPEIAEIRRKYQRAGILMSILVSIPSFLPIAWFGMESAIPALCFTGGIFLLVIGYGILFLVGYRRMKILKAGTTWADTAENLVVVETGFNTGKTTPSILWFLPMPLSILASLLLTLLFYGSAPDIVPTHFNAAGVADGFARKSPGTFLLVPFMQFFLAVVFAFAWISIRKAKQMIDPENPVASADQNRRFRYAWAMFLLISGDLLCTSFVFITATMLQLVPATWFILLTAILIIGILAGSLFLSVRYGQGGSRLGAGSHSKASGVINRNDDRFWKLGTFYCNREDPALFLEKRFGIGWTLNFGRPVTWILLLVLLLFIAASLLAPILFT